MTIATQKRAIKLAHKVYSSQHESTINAIKCGQALLKVQKSLPYGTFIQWIINNMPISDVTCWKYMRLAKAHQAPFNKFKFLDIQSESNLLKENTFIINIIRTLHTKQYLSQRDVANILRTEKPMDKLAEIKYVKTTLSALSNKLNILNNIKILSKQEKIEITNSLKQIIKSIK